MPGPIDIQIKVHGKGTSPTHISTDQTVELIHEHGNKLTLASVHNAELFEDKAGYSWVVNDLMRHPTVGGRMVVLKYSPTGEHVPLTLMISAAVVADYIGTGLLTWREGTRDSKDHKRIENQLRNYADKGFLFVKGEDSVQPSDDGHGGETIFHYVAFDLVDETKFNPHLVKSIKEGLDKAILKAASDHIKDKVPWSKLPKVWRRWLSNNNFYLLKTDQEIGYAYRETNHVSLTKMNSTGWEPKPKSLVSRFGLENMVLRETLKTLGMPHDRPACTRLKEYIKQYRKNPDIDLIELATKDQKDFGDPSKLGKPMLVYYAESMLQGDWRW